MREKKGRSGGLFSFIDFSMASYNKVTLLGNVTRDPELRYTPKGQAVVEVGMAMNRKYRVEDEMREETTFVDVTFWGKQAEVIAQYVKKGREFFCDGRLRLDTWDDKTTGQKRNKLRVVGDNFQFVGGGGQRDEAGGGGGGYSSSRPAAPPQQHQAPSSAPAAPAPAEEDDDIPF